MTPLQDRVATMQNNSAASLFLILSFRDAGFLTNLQEIKLPKEQWTGGQEVSRGPRDREHLSCWWFSLRCNICIWSLLIRRPKVVKQVIMELMKQGDSVRNNQIMCDVNEKRHTGELGNCERLGRPQIRQPDNQVVDERRTGVVRRPMHVMSMLVDVGGDMSEVVCMVQFNCCTLQSRESMCFHCSLTARDNYCEFNFEWNTNTQKVPGGVM